jgi:hypothetical protein
MMQYGITSTLPHVVVGAACSIVAGPDSRSICHTTTLSEIFVPLASRFTVRFGSVSRLSRADQGPPPGVMVNVRDSAPPQSQAIHRIIEQ